MTFSIKTLLLVVAFAAMFANTVRLERRINILEHNVNQVEQTRMTDFDYFWWRLKPVPYPNRN